MKSPFYVDKTMFIEKVIECPAEHMLNTAPRRFNKSVNLVMLRRFFESEDYESIFAALKIDNTPTMDLCGEVPIVFLDLKKGVTTVNSLDDAVESCRMSIRSAYLEHSYLSAPDSKLLPQEKNSFNYSVILLESSN